MTGERWSSAPMYPEVKKDVFSVSRLNMEVRAALENSFPLLWVTGEISNLSQPRSGHLYFTLKDPDAQVRCALFRSRRLNLRYLPENGQQVLVRARVTLFEPRGDFQLVVEHLEPAGEGALRQQVEALKARLAAEGLFDANRKRPLPPFPRRIGVITSPSGAAVRDVLTVLRRRWPIAAVVVHPVPVQGDGAASEIRRMIEVADARNECDLLVLTRGGGSLEDLMAFNDEQVVRAIAACRTPLVSAVGHEIDFTLADLAADRRAPTPSAAAELVSPDAAELAGRFGDRMLRLHRILHQLMTRQELRTRGLLARLVQAHPGRRILVQQQRIDELDRRMARIVKLRIEQLDARVAQLGRRLVAQNPRRRVLQAVQGLAQLGDRLQRAWHARLGRARERLQALSRELHAVSPLATLGRGYAIVRRESDGSLITRAADAVTGERLEARFSEGSLLCRVEETRD